jgi:DNA-binding NarL/FixJ family response regulator
MIRIVIADDHTLFREGLRRVLDDAEGVSVVAEVADGNETLTCVRETEAEILLLDLSMPGKSGIELVRLVHDAVPSLQILVLTMHEEEQYAVRAIRAGARGYITKESSALQLIDAIYKVDAGRPVISVVVAEQLALDAMPDTRSLPHKELSDREFEVFIMLVSGKSITEIAELLHLSVKTISSHKTRIMQKMSFGSVPDLVQYALAYRLVVPMKI